MFLMYDPLSKVLNLFSSTKQYEELKNTFLNHGVFCKAIYLHCVAVGVLVILNYNFCEFSNENKMEVGLLLAVVLKASRNQ